MKVMDVVLSVVFAVTAAEDVVGYQA